LPQTSPKRHKSEPAAAQRADGNNVDIVDNTLQAPIAAQHLDALIGSHPSVSAGYPRLYLQHLFY
jgi:hypothetical protein